MSLDYAVDRLYDTGWNPSSSMLLQQLEDGRLYPAVTGVNRAFADAGLKLSIRHVALFNCFRAEWVSVEGDVSRSGYCVGATEAEAAVFALAQLVEAQQEIALGA